MILGEFILMETRGMTSDPRCTLTQFYHHTQWQIYASWRRVRDINYFKLFWIAFNKTSLFTLFFCTLPPKRLTYGNAVISCNFLCFLHFCIRHWNLEMFKLTDTHGSFVHAVRQNTDHVCKNMRRLVPCFFVMLIPSNFNTSRSLFFGLCRVQRGVRTWDLWAFIYRYRLQ